MDTITDTNRRTGEYTPQTPNKKNALVTGASRGIGAACAAALAKAGYTVFLNAHHSVQELQALCQTINEKGGDAFCIPGDVSDSDQVREMFHRIEEQAPGIDLLVNNAGISHIGLLQDMTDEQWDRLIATDLSSVFYCCRAAIPYMIRQKSGRIINISSMWGVSGASCEAAYSAAKSAVNGLTRSLAKELAPSGICVNAIACGVIDTQMNACFCDSEREALCEDIPAGRFGTPDEVAALVLSIAQAPSYMTGQIIGLDGGYL